MTISILPTEDEEQINVVEWLELMGLKFTAVPNHTYNPHHSQQNKNRRLGLRAGLPDLLVVVPNVGLLFIEMKRRKKSYASAEQKAWIEALNTVPGVEARVCRGSDEAIAFVSEFLPAQLVNQPIF